MNIAIVAPSPVPFQIGGAEKLFWGMVKHFNEHTPHFVELLKIPVRDQDFWSLMDGYRRFAEFDLSFYDAVITTKYPAWALHHPQHHVYMQHTCRGVYDLYRGATHWEPECRALKALARLLEEPPRRSLFPRFFTELFSLKDHPDIPPQVWAFPGPLTRRIIFWLDRAALNPEAITTYAAISHNVARRAHYFPPEVAVEVLHHPSDLTDFHEGPYETVFTASRLHPLKRVDLLLRAFRRVKAPLSFRIAGTGSEMDRLKSLAEGDPRVVFLGHVSDRELLAEYARALFVPFIPFDEDYGLITVEAMHSAKAVLTTVDAGGVNELVAPGRTGLSVEPDEAALADAMTRLIADPQETQAMGRRAKEAVAHINWKDFTARFFDHLADGRRRAAAAAAVVPSVASARPRVVVVNTFAATPPVSGGRVRLLEMARSLGARAHVTVLCLVSCRQAPTVLKHTPHLVEEWVPRSEEHARRDAAYATLLGVSADDVSAITAWRLTPRFGERLRALTAEADLVVLSHPYLVEAVRSCYGGPLWLDAHNVEVDLKATLFQPGAEAEAALARVREAEGRAVQESQRIIACSREDARRLQDLYGGDPDRFVVVPNGMAMREVRRLDAEAQQALRRRLGLDAAPVVLFMGSAHGPNRDAALWLMEAAGRHGDLRFWIMGSVCEDRAVREACADNVTLLGVLNSAEKAVALNAAHCAVNPVTSGSGTNVKMLEYAAYGLPIVTTPQGNRGLAFEPGRHVVESDHSGLEQAMVATARGALEGHATLKAMGQEAAAMAAACYDWPKVCQPLLGLLSTL